MHKPCTTPDVCLPTETEKWAVVLDFPNYRVSDLARIESIGWPGIRVDGGGKFRSGRTLRQHINRKGYPMVRLYRDGVSKGRSVHRIVLEAFEGPCPPGMEARHLNGIRSDARLVNLAWGTKLENEADRKAHDTVPKGESHGGAKLTEADVIEIRASSLPTRVLSARFGVSVAAILDVRTRRRWRHI